MSVTGNQHIDPSTAVVENRQAARLRCRSFSFGLLACLDLLDLLTEIAINISSRMEKHDRLHAFASASHKLMLL